MIAALAGLTAAAGYGAANFFGGLASRRQHATITLLIAQTTALPIVIAAALLIPGRPGAMSLGAAAGLLGFAGAAAAYLAYSLGRPVGIAAVLLGTTSAAVPTAAGIISGTRPGPLAVTGLIAAAAALTVLAWPDQTATDTHAAALAATAGVMFGLYHTVMSRTPSATGLWPLVASQTVIVTLAVITTVTLRQRPRRGPAAAMSVGDGLASTIATMAALAAVRTANLPSAGTLIALSPAITTLLARYITHERLQPKRAAGLVLALTAIACLTPR
jgi:drug/metabolite transporter (DMT)-like permease